MALSNGQLVDSRYRIDRRIGRGGMGTVYAAENIRIQRRVAIKVLKEELAASPDAVRRFEQEAQAAGKIGSDHIVQVLDIGSLPNGTHYMVMEYLDGAPLSRLIARGPIEPERATPLFVQLLEGLRGAHDAGIIHRDLKPENIFVVRELAGVRDFVKILDFGISKFSVMNESQAEQTVAGALMGTPYYMSPEQLNEARAVDHRSDLYSVGVMLYLAVTGHLPYEASTLSELISKTLHERPLDPLFFTPDLDGRFSHILLKAMSTTPEDRYQTAAEFQQALVHWLDHFAPARSRAGRPGSQAPARATSEWFDSLEGASCDLLEDAGTSTSISRPAVQAPQTPGAVGTPHSPGPILNATVAERATRAKPARASEPPPIQPAVKLSAELAASGPVRELPPTPVVPDAVTLPFLDRPSLAADDQLEVARFAPRRRGRVLATMIALAALLIGSIAAVAMTHIDTARGHVASVWRGVEASADVTAAIASPAVSSSASSSAGVAPPAPSPPVAQEQHVEKRSQATGSEPARPAGSQAASVGKAASGSTKRRKAPAALSDYGY